MNGDIILGVILGFIILATIIGIAEAIGVGDFNDTCSKESDSEDSWEGFDVLPGSVPLGVSKGREHNP